MSKTTHGFTNTPTYKSWDAMLTRCRNKNAPSYPLYGGRGIRVCQRWEKFENFLEDMGIRPSRSYSIDRIDPNGNYCKANCRWATTKEQGQNKRVRKDAVFGVINGKKYRITDLMKKTDLSYKAIHARIVRLNFQGTDLLLRKRKSRFTT